MKNWHRYILLGILALHLALSIISINQPFQGDEVVFPACAKNYIETGKLEFNFSTLNPGYKCLWHPPLYINLMAGSIYTFGDSVYAIRGISALFNFLTIIIVYFTLKEIWKSNRKKEIIGLTGAFIYALNPLVIQSSVAVDIDGGILNFFIMLFLLLFIKKKSFAWLIPSLFLVFWSKFAGIIILIPVLLIYHAYLKEWKELRRSFFLLVITGLIFLASFYAYTSAINADFMMTFVHNFAGRGAGFLSYLGIIKAAWALKSFVYFAVPFLIVLFSIFTFMFHKTIWGKEKYEFDKNILLYNIFAIFTILFYTYLKGTSWLFPKYFITSMASIAIFTASYIFTYFDTDKFKENISNNKRTIKLIILFIILLIYFKLAIGDPLIPEFDETKENANLAMATLLIMKSFSLYILIPFLVSLLFIDNMNKNGIILTLMFLILFAYVYIGFTQANADYSTYSRYGDGGVRETIDYLSANNISAREIAGYLYIGYYMGVSDYTDVSIVFNNATEFKEKIVDNNDIKYMIIFNRDIARIGDNMKYFELEKRFGGNYIYRRMNITS